MPGQEGEKNSKKLKQEIMGKNRAKKNEFIKIFTYATKLDRTKILYQMVSKAILYSKIYKYWPTERFNLAVKKMNYSTKLLWAERGGYQAHSGMAGKVSL